VPDFKNGDMQIAYLDEGEGEAIILIHGFASNKETNWVAPGWVKTLTASGYRVIALDNRGHGQSAKPHDSGHYEQKLMAGDALALLDHLAIKRADIIGYSMGARLALCLAGIAPQRVRSLVLGGVGLGLVEGMAHSAAIAQALTAEDPASVTDPTGKAYRSFADQTKSDRLALAACVASMRVPVAPETLSAISVPTLVAVGTRDLGVGSPEGLAALIPGAGVFMIVERDHMSAVGDKSHKAAVLAFLDERP